MRQKRRCTIMAAGAVFTGMLLLAAGLSVGATTYYVSVDTGSDVNSGTNWAEAFQTVTNAIKVATDGDTIIVTNGVYRYDRYADGSKSTRITNAVTLRSVNGYKVTTLWPTWGYASGVPSPVELAHEGAVVEGFKITGYGWEGGCVRLEAGLVQNCWLTGGYAYRGGGVSLSGEKDADSQHKATIRNCLISGNRATDGRGGGVRWNANYAGVVDSCTIVGNTAGSAGNGGGGLQNVQTGGILRNSIVHGNTSTGVKQDFEWTASTAGLQHNCITRDYTSGGTGNITNNPSFVSEGGGDYRLNPDSPCRDKGIEQDWMAGAKDLDGVVPRIMPVAGGTNDIGCFEFDTDALTGSFTASPRYGFPPLAVTFTSAVSGDTNGIVYRWDIGADGTYEAEGGGLASFTTNLGIGRYSVALNVTNAAGSSASITNLNYVRVGPRTNYVDVAGLNPLSPYTSWASAATNLQPAIDLGVPGTVTLVATGTYEIGNACVTNDTGVILRSVGGYTVTKVKGSQPYTGATGIFRIDHADAVVDGFTITGSGHTAAPVYLHDGLIQNCWITGNTTYRPGGVRLWAGTVRNCLISGNTGTDGDGGVEYASSGGLVESCTIVNNYGGAGQGGGGVRNRHDGGIIRNTIVHGNTTADGAPRGDFYFLNTANIDHCCITTNYTTGGTGNITNNPQFVDAAAGDYRLRKGSPCIDTGVNQAWMFVARDLAGNPRVVRSVVDMGALESPPYGTLLILR